MAKGFNIEVKGLKETLDKLGDEAEEIKFEVKGEIEAAGAMIRTTAIDNISSVSANANGKEYRGVDVGFLKGSITNPVFVSEYAVQVIVQAKYAPYIEFGTGNLFVSTGSQIWDEIALQFKGKGIKEINLPPRPFLRPAVQKEVPIMTAKIKNILDEPRKI